MSEMTEEEFIAQAKLDWEDGEIETIEQALEVCYQNGSFDEVSGDVESPTGHFYQTERWIVTTDSRGNHKVHTFKNSKDAEVAFEDLERQYDEWTEDENA